jgi:Uma2 family endonuclease
MAYALKHETPLAIPETEGYADAPELTLIQDEWVGLVPSRPMTAEQFYRRYTGRSERVQLLDGKVVLRPMVQREHEAVDGWLYSLFTWYLEAKDLGRVFHSRRAVELTPFKVRMPDLSFVRKDRLAISEEKAIKGAPDLVIEVVSPGDRKADLLASEADYRTLGVREIIYIYPQGKPHIRILRRVDDAGTYDEETLRSGQAWVSSAIPGMVLEADWILKEPRPSLAATLARLTQADGSPNAG